MSKVWKNPVLIPAWVTVTVDADLVTVQWPKWTLQQVMYPGIVATVDAGSVVLSCDDVALWKFRWTMRSLIANMITGVTDGYSKTLQVIGVGFDASLQWQNLNLKLWFSHPVVYLLPQGIEVKVEKDPKGNPLIHLASHDKQLIWKVSAEIRKLKKPEPYKGKGIRFLWEIVKLKAGKSAKK